MRCASCARLGLYDLLGGREFRLHDTLDELIQSAGDGCDLCKLCWTCFEQSRFLRDSKNLKYDERFADDNSVWLQGYVYPGLRPNFMRELRDKAISNTIHVYLGADFLRDDDANDKRNPNRMNVGELHIFADPGTPASLMFRGTWITVDRNPQEHIRFTRRYIDSCQAIHKLCCLVSAKSKAVLQMPTRLIDLGESKDRKSVRLVITRDSGIQAPYVALSYCWGRGGQSQPVLNDQNLEELLSYIDEEQLPKVHRDAFQLTRDLGYRYIWIDALCIIQRHKEDWENESKRMSHVYGSAELTIIAGRAADCEGGFLENRLRHSAGPCSIPFLGEEAPGHADYLIGNRKLGEMGELGSVWITLPRSLEDGPVSERGWCFQEVMLSSRAIIFGKEQIRFQCQELSSREDGSVDRSPLYRVQNAQYRIHPPAPLDSSPSNSESELDAEKTYDKELRRWGLAYWYKDILLQYTRRETTDASDVFAALSGLVQDAKSKIRSRYIVGLWEVDMVRGLLWKPRHAHSRNARYSGQCQRRTMILKDDTDNAVLVEPPSWSWAAIKGQVGVKYLDREEMLYHDSNVLIRPKYKGRWTEDSTCHAEEVSVPSYYQLEFFGRPRRVRVRPDPRGVPKWAKDHKDPTYARVCRCRVLLLPMRENETEQTLLGNRGLDGSEDPVARGFFDISADGVSICWCIPLTKREGLILIRDNDGKYRRAGTMLIEDLAWMMSVEEEEICLI
ncbi:heterokaryon incompatibility protein-domain-containing protein [Xylaria intraflava]|nr:heterokaryon incompatibility protein-domain-containing protein [Xylaria intraflava]